MLKPAFFVCQANAEESRYDFYVEFSDTDLSKSDIEHFLSEIENDLMKTNLEYATKRKSLRLNSMQLIVLGENSLDKYKNWKVSNGIREAQFKITPLVSDNSFLEPLIVKDTYGQEEAA